MRPAHYCGFTRFTLSSVYSLRVSSYGFSGSLTVPRYSAGVQEFTKQIEVLGDLVKAEGL